MSENVEFILSLDDKKFSAAIDRAGKLLIGFGEKAVKPTQKIVSLERSIGSTARILDALDTKLKVSTDSLENLGAGLELVTSAIKATRQELVTLSSSIKTFASRIDKASESTVRFEHLLKGVQSELSDFSDWANHAGNSAGRFANNAREAASATSSMNTRLGNTNKRLESWSTSTDKAAAGLKKVSSEMDAVINRQQLLNRPMPTSGRLGGGRGSSGGRVSPRGRANDGFLDGLKGNIFMLGEVGDAARTVKDMLFSWQVPIVNAAAEMQKMRILLQGLNKDAANPAAAAETDMSYIVNMAKNAPFAMSALTDSFVKFRSAGLDPADGSLKSLVDSVARFGGDSELLKRAAVAIQQMSGKGVISMEELRQQLGEAVPTAMQAMADAAGITMSQLTKAISTGTVSAKEGLKLLFQGLDAQNRGAAEDLMVAYTGALAQLQTSFTLFSDKIGRAGYLDSITKAFREISGFMNSTDGQVFAQGVGESLKSAVDGMMSLAKWSVDNKNLLISLGEAAAAMVGFTILKNSVLGVASAGAEMGGVIGKSLKTVNSAGMGTIGAIGKLTKSVRDFGATATLIIGIGEAIKMARAAWLSFSAVIIANPVGAALTAIAIAVGSIITVMTLLKDRTAETVAEIRKIPAAMNAAQRAQIQGRILQLEDQNRSDKETLAQMKSGKLSASAIGIDEKSLAARIDKSEKDIAYFRETRGMGDKAVSEGLANEIVTKRLADVDTGINKALASYSSTSQKEAQKQRVLIDQDKTLSPSQKQARLEKVNGADRDANLKPYTDGIAKTQTIVDTLGREVTRLTNELAKPGLTESDRSKLEGQINGQANAYKRAQDSLEGLKNTANGISQSRYGLPLLDGSKATGVGSDSKTNDRLTKAYIESLRGKGTQVRMNSDGTVMKDFMGDNVVGDAQLKANQKLRNILGENLKYDQMTADQQKMVSETLANAKIKDATRAAAAQERASKSAAAAAKREETAQQKALKANETWIDKAESMAGQLGLSSKASVEFDQNIQQVTKHLDEMVNAVPSDALSNGMIANAKTLRDFINQNKDVYSKRLNEDAAEQSITKFAPMANSVIQDGFMPDYQTKAAEWNRKFNESVSYLQSQSANTQDAGMKAVYDRALSQMLAGRNKAFVSQVGTATQQLALQYTDLASQMEQSWSGTFDRLTDTLLDFTKTGKLNIADLGDYMYEEFMRMVIRSQVVAPMMNSLGMGGGDGGSSTFKSGANLITSSGSAIAGLFGFGGSKTEDGSGNLTETSKGLANALGEATEKTNELSQTGFSGMLTSMGQWIVSLFTGTTAKATETAASTTTASSLVTLAAAAQSASFALASVGASGGGGGGIFGTLLSGATTALSAYYGGGGAGGSVVGSGGGMSLATDSNSAFNAGVGWQNPNIPAFAKGGIFGPDGVVPLNKYAKGGIADRPQLALFGEGAHKEAYVPLPDGRSIPVTFTGDEEMGGGSQVNQTGVSINITVNKDGSENSSGDDDATAWNSAAKRIKAIALETIAEEKRPGGILNGNSSSNR
jgi:tape measure domain-containing protein